jgi:uroporphyrinogen decarboxylase
MKSIDRVLKAISYGKPDRIPLVHSLTFYGAKELGISIEDYFSNPENVVEGQVLMQKKYHNDCYWGFYYGSMELEAFGGNSIFFDDCPPNAGVPIIKSLKDIENLKEPDIEECIGLQKVLQTIRLLKQESNGEIPILGGVISPFSLPIMQMGFGKYLDLLIYNREMFWKLMEINKKYSIKWANAQLEAGATAIGYMDPALSPSILNKDLFLETGWLIAKEVIPSIKGSTAIHLASGIVIPIIEEILQTGTQIISVSANEDIGIAKKLAQSRMAVMGNLNGIEMCRWDKADAEEAVKDIIKKAGKGGGLIISDNHGDIPFQVPENVLLAITSAVEKYGVY